MKFSFSITTFICLISLILVGFHLYLRHEGHPYAETSLHVALVLGGLALLSFAVRFFLRLAGMGKQDEEEFEEGPGQDQ